MYPCTVCMYPFIMNSALLEVLEVAAPTATLYMSVRRCGAVWQPLGSCWDRYTVGTCFSLKFNI